MAMYSIPLPHWVTGIVLAAVLHIGVGWAIFRESPEPDATPSTGLSVEIFSSGIESLAASSDIENVEMVEADPVETAVEETVMEPDMEVLEVAEIAPPVEQELAEDVPPEPVQDITPNVEEFDNVELEMEAVPVDTTVEVNPVEAVTPQPAQEITANTESPEYVEVARLENVEPAEAKVEPAPAEVVKVVEKPAATPPVRRLTKPRATEEEKTKNPVSAEAAPSRVANVASTPQSSAINLAAIEQPGVDAENIRDSYFASISALLAKSKRYPKRAVRRKIEGTVKVNLVIGRNGELVSFDITQTSSHSVLDREVERMIQRTAPYPEIPTQIAGNTLSITVPVEFFLR